MSSSDPAAVGARLLEARKRADISREKLGAKIGVAGQTIYRWERGGRAKAENLAEAASELGVSSDWLLYGRGDLAPVADTLDPPHWAEFLEMYPHIDQITPEDLRDIRNFAARDHRISTWYDWAKLADVVLNLRPSRIHEEKIRSRE